jgi:hypothetical protein
MSTMHESDRFAEVLAYEKGFLPEDEREDLEVHMDGCKECLRMLKSMRGNWPEMFPTTGLSRMSADAYQVMSQSGLR